ncbi:mobilization protein (plasmid) [Yersinia similis]|uniref:Mobilization protein n=1 Tax=Yersinia similis TaxID=367190 RepID=A0ABM5Q4Y7_9GAMM|nr:hypothetical protein [Yersinia similis]AHK22080.1 mobilization protein [Yersinia similis]CFQ66508.1 Uncharacterised protein [Yersinia similis]CNB82081.1 Uncharacterised protein [Yersinia similis]
MAINSYYTQEQLELAKMQLADLPDLNASRMTGKDVLANLREQLIDLSVKKGYSVTEIKSALDVAGITVSAKAIKETIDSNITMKKKKASAAKINTLNSSTQP